jgi:hypothetical protein
MHARWLEARPAVRHGPARLTRALTTNPCRRLSGGVGPLRDDALHRLVVPGHASDPRRSDMLGPGSWSALESGGAGKKAPFTSRM